MPLSLLFLLAWAAPLLAHGTLQRAEPAAGSRLAVAPTVLRLTFSEAMEAAVSRLVLTGPDGRVVPLSPLRRGDSAKMLVADVAGPLVAGRYTVTWQGAGRDGHPVHGRYEFTIAADAAGLAPTPTAPDTMSRAAPAPVHEMPRDSLAGAGDESFGAQSPSFAIVRWLQLVGILALVGTIGLSLLVLPSVTRSGAPAALAADAERRARSFGLAAAALLCLVAVLRMLAQSAALHGGAHPLDVGMASTMMRGTLWGRAWMLQLAAAVGAAIGFLLVGRARAAGWSIVVLSTFAVALSAALSGHAAVADDAGLAVAIDTVHVLGAGGWLGTLLLVVLAGLPAALRLAPAERGANVAAVVNAFSPLALVFAAAVVLSGAGSAWLHLGSLGAFWSTTYGRVLLLKLGAIALLAAAGAYNWRWVRPSLGHESAAVRMRRSATVELLIGALVLAVTAVLMATRTPV